MNNKSLLQRLEIAIVEESKPSIAYCLMDVKNTIVAMRDEICRKCWKPKCECGDCRWRNV